MASTLGVLGVILLGTPAFASTGHNTAVPADSSTGELLFAGVCMVAIVAIAGGVIWYVARTRHRAH